MANRMMSTMTVAIVAAATMGGTARAGDYASSGVGEYAVAAAVKGGTGLAQILYSPIDLVTTPAGFAVEMDGDGRAALGFGLGLFVGPINASLRAGAGLRDLLTFPFCQVGREREFHFDPYLTGWNPMGARPAVPTAVAFAPHLGTRAPRPSGD